MIAPSNTFKHRYLRFAELSETTTIEPFALATDPNATTLEERCNFLVNDIENVFLVSDGNGGVTILHSFKQLGNTLRNPTSKVVALQGLGSNVTPLIVDPRDLMSHETIFVPKIESIYDCDSVETLKALPPPLEDPATTTTYHCSKCAIPGPIELKAILELDDTTCPYNCIQAILNSRHALEMEDDVDPSNRLIHFLWAIGEKQIGRSPFSINMDDPLVQEFVKERLAKCILPRINADDPLMPTQMSDRTFTQLGATLSTLVESNNNANHLNAANLQRIADNEAKKKDRIKKFIDDDTFKIIIFGGTSDGENPLDDIPDTFKTIFNAETSGDFGRKLLTYFTLGGFPNTHINNQALQSMYAGNYFPLDVDIVKDFSAFSFSETKPMQQNQRDHFMFLHMADTNGKPKSAEEIKASMAQSVAVPSDYYELFECAQRYLRATELVFTRDSIYYVSYEKFVGWLKREKYLIRQLYTQDPHICSKILYAAEIRCKLFWKDCLEAEFVEDIDFSILEFDRIHHDLKLKNFHVSLPVCFVEVSPKTPTSPKRPLPEQEIKPADDLSKRQVVKNENINPSFALKEGDEWVIFTGRVQAEKRPTFGGKRVCHKYHSKGYCFSDCANAASHCDFNTLPPETQKEYIQWMDNCRKLAKATKKD